MDTRVVRFLPYGEVPDMEIREIRVRVPQIVAPPARLDGYHCGTFFVEQPGQARTGARRYAEQGLFVVQHEEEVIPFRHSGNGLVGVGRRRVGAGAAGRLNFFVPARARTSPTLPSPVSGDASGKNSSLRGVGPCWGAL